MPFEEGGRMIDSVEPFLNLIREFLAKGKFHNWLHFRALCTLLLFIFVRQTSSVCATPTHIFNVDPYMRQNNCTPIQRIGLDEGRKAARVHRHSIWLHVINDFVCLTYKAAMSKIDPIVRPESLLKCKYGYLFFSRDTWPSPWLFTFLILLSHSSYYHYLCYNAVGEVFGWCIWIESRWKRVSRDPTGQSRSSMKA